ncbi:DNA-binding protein [Puteibacter caeruleilacunae]|nr:DNA-binding protein [Puteibacter caeruleilacunae]
MGIKSFKQMKIKKSKLNLLIDILMFVIMVLVAGIGFLIRYVLVPGFQRNAIYGNDVELYYLGMDRHQWGTIHLWLSLALIFLLLLHIVFHWKQIVGIFKTMVPIRTLRLALSSLLILFTIVFGIMPLFVSPEVDESVVHYSRHREVNRGDDSEEKLEIIQPVSKQSQEVQSTKGNKGDRKHVDHSEIEIFGYMTINEVAEKYNVSAQELAKSINVPNGNNDIKLGRLKKKYTFQISELRDYIEQKSIK